MTLHEHTHTHLLAHHKDFAAFAEAMVESHTGRFDRVFWAFVEQYAPATVKRVVDFGTGPGLLVRDLAERFEDAEVVGVDGQPEMLAKARELIGPLSRCRLVEADLAVPPIPGLEDASADLLVSSMVLHELQVPSKMLDETARVLRPGGVFVLYDWKRHPLAQYAKGERPSDLDEFTHFSEHCRYTEEDYAFLVEQSGFEILERMTRREGRRVLLAAKRLER